MKTVGDYQHLWDNVSRYYLVPGELASLPNRKFKYVIYQRLLLMRTIIFVPARLRNEVFDRMIEAGAEIITEPIDWDNFSNIERLWTDLLDEVALIPIDNGNDYKIFHKVSGKTFGISASDKKQKIIESMINAGVEILDES